MNKNVIVGIDEVGRGPLAGPVVIGAYVVPVENYAIFTTYTTGIKDSKKLSTSKRQQWIQRLDNTLLGFCVLKEKSAEEIDENGISWCLLKNIEEALVEIEHQGYTIEKVLLDGSLKAPHQHTQETIIKGDESQPLISAASIFAKEYRDDYMKKLGIEYPGYGFESNMGYGTLQHYKALKELGIISTVHRFSYLKKMIALENK